MKNIMKRELGELLEKESAQGILEYFNETSYLKTQNRDVKELIRLYKANKVSVDNIIENVFKYKGENLHFIIYLLKKNNLN